MNLHNPLGQATAYIETYTPELLFPIVRNTAQDFFGYDLWHAYEISWLDAAGKPHVTVAEFIFPCHSPFLIESKSFKLYLNSFNQTTLASPEALEALLQKDLSAACGAPVQIKINPDISVQSLTGICLDSQKISCDTYHVQPDYLQCEPLFKTESLYSHLLKSNCPVTNQPDWGSVKIEYTGQQINHAGLLRYIVSYRNHQDFHEHCVEQIFTDIWQRCKPEKLIVGAYYTRRGGLDINPIRASEEIPVETLRLWRQ